MASLIPFDSLVLGCLILLYMLPSLIGAARDVRGLTSLFWMNLFFGWTAFGWAALVWIAVYSPSDQEADDWRTYRRGKEPWL